jgi:hypothetical protein
MILGNSREAHCRPNEIGTQIALPSLDDLDGTRFRRNHLKKYLVVISAAMIAAVCSPAEAEQIAFSFTTSQALLGGPATGNGFFNLASNSTMLMGQTAFEITSITGIVDGSAIVAPMGDYGAYYATGPSFLDGAGANFITAAGTNVSFFYEDAVSQYRVNTTNPFTTSFVAASAAPVAAVPEPNSWMLWLAGLGLIGVGAAFRQSGRKAAIA